MADLSRPPGPRPAPLPKPRGCDDCGAPGRRGMAGGSLIEHAEGCFRHPSNRCPLCGRHHATAEECVFHGREFDPDAHELVQTAQAALANLFEYRMSHVNRETWLTTLECHLTVLCDDLPNALPDASAPMECTGISATWCPIHGDCDCGRLEDGDVEYAGGEHSCPLHAINSPHGEEADRA